MRVRRAVINLLPADVREDSLRVTRVARYLFEHQRDRVSDAFFVRVVEGKPHSQHDAALETLALVGLERRRILVAAAMEEERRNALDLAPVEIERTGDLATPHVHHRDDDGGAP